MSADAYLAMQQAMCAPKSSGARLLCLLPNIDGSSILGRDISGPLWQTFSLVGGKKGGGFLETLFGGYVTRGWPTQTSIGEFAQMTTGDLPALGLVAPLTPMSGGGGGSGIEIG